MSEKETQKFLFLLTRSLPFKTDRCIIIHNNRWPWSSQTSQQISTMPKPRIYEKDTRFQRILTKSQTLLLYSARLWESALT